MAPKAPESAAPALPSTTDFNALYNRISLAAAKQNTFLTSMRAKYPSLKKTSTPTQTPASSAPSTSGFSSLRPETTAPTTTTSLSVPTKTKAQLRAEQEDAADPLRYDSPNAGLGFVPSKAEAHADAATQDLSRRILGKRAREIKNRGAAGNAAKRRAAVDEESDEDEGRSGLGRRKRTRAMRSGEVEDDTEVMAPPVVEVLPEPKPEMEAALEGSPEAAPASETPAPNASEGKKKKKKNKKKKQSQE
ncbi:hypothetical protein F5X68DRAFT_258321 [Plectosphaerella plurivora]|uniref:Uncharacterized protein n=1 Tax=Plectosphaerella plurivora TaxID=936078 RepID=A0A9P8VNB0_9PEZI|nr:hypothetical protein F5X68DRAFT_258321 [Plectosphaerella plurivora]